MTTIDKLDIDVHIQYAERVEAVRQITEDYGLDQTTAISPQVQALDLFPKVSELDLLLGVATVTTPWALFLPPPSFRLRRRSPFAVSRIIPSLGTVEEHEDLETHIQSLPCETPEEEREKSAILACFSQIDKINQWLTHIVDRIHQFLQG